MGRILVSNGDLSFYSLVPLSLVIPCEIVMSAPAVHLLGLTTGERVRMLTATFQGLFLGKCLKMPPVSLVDQLYVDFAEKSTF